MQLSRHRLRQRHVAHTNPQVTDLLPPPAPENGRKRHIVVDTLGLLMVVAVTTASVQDRDGGATVLERLRFTMPSVVTVFADGGYAGRLVVYAREVLRVAVELVNKPPDQRGFAVLPRR